MTRRQGIVVTAALLLAAAVLLFVFALRLTSKPGTKVHLGESTFKIRRADRFADEIAKHGPLLFQDLLNKSRDIYVQHQGRDDKAGWSAFLAHPENERRTCQIVWRQKSHDFRDPCSKQIYPGDGAGLPHYKVTVADNGDLTVDLNAPAAGP
ncbi:MAG: hypothetical protein JOZ37_13100 [Actinobacteria bacterium]|nr:hypothetical protein [Actinomycetota bacterium]MBV8960554.1 hypothetical protein [Actinomycetota bacterium]MBV9664898.1 hypothetical protein [Actinomycetota bacterium]